MADITPLVTASYVASKTVPPPAEGGTLIATEIQSAPARFAQLTRPLQINGVIVMLQDSGQFVFHTAAGNLTLALPLPQGGGRNPLAELLTPLVQNQKPLNLVIQPGSPPTQALLSVPAQAATAQPVAYSAMAGAPKAPVSAFTPGNILSAVVLPKGVAEAFAMPAATASSSPAAALSNAAGPAGSAGLSGAMAASASEAASGISLGGFISSPALMTKLAEFLKTPTTASFAESLKAFLGEAHSGIATEATAAPQIAAQAATPAAAPGTTAPAAGTLQPGAECSLRLVAVIPPEASAPQALGQDQILATVIGRGSGGQLLLNADGNTLFLRQGGNIAVGSRLVLTLLPPQEKSDFMLPPAHIFDAPALTRAMAALMEVEPMLAQQVMAKSIPQPNAMLPATLLFLFSALQQGGVQGWLGAAAAGRFGKMDKLELIAKLAEEMQQAGGPARDPVVGQWRAWPIPLYDGSQFQMLRLYVRRERDRQQAAGYPVSPQTRFLITMNMSRLGPMQMDGLAQKKKLDLILRSEQSLPAYLPNELRTLYGKNLEALGLSGSINFQTGRRNWIEIQKMEKTGSGGVVT